jgi:hypothetical protein
MPDRKLSSIDCDVVVKKLIQKFENNTLEVGDLYYNKDFYRYADECVAQEFFRRMRRNFMDSKINIDILQGKQSEIIRWLKIKQCTKNKCGQWLDKRMGVVENCQKCKMKKEEKKNKLKFMSIAKPFVCCETIMCSMCLDDMNEGEKVSKLCCGHSFHPPCIENWILKYNKQQCPNCRTEVHKKQKSKKM